PAGRAGQPAGRASPPAGRPGQPDLHTPGRPRSIFSSSRRKTPSACPHGDQEGTEAGRDRTLRPAAAAPTNKRKRMGIVYMPRPAIGFERSNIPKLMAGSEVVQGRFAANSATLQNP